MFWLQKSTRDAWSKRSCHVSWRAPGSSRPASCSDGERASEAGSRWQSRENGGGLSMIPHLRAARSEGRGSEHSSREGVLVSTKRSPLTRRSWRRAWRPHRVGPAARLDPVRARPRQRTSEALALGSVRGRELRCRVAPRGGALDRGSARTAQRVVPVFSSVRANTRSRHRRPGRRGQAEAGGSPSSEASPVIRWRSSTEGGSAEVGAAPVRERDRRCARESGSPEGARNAGWLQKSERRIFLAAVVSRGVTRGERGRWDSLKRPSSL